MLQGGGGLYLQQEAIPAEGGANLGPEHLEGDPAAVFQVFGEIDRGHPAPSELALDPVPMAQTGL